ncbi:MAG: grasp-with-spasm system SPASM domain peptide maturase [Bacteroidales bacterium]|nr:grasp-with-spasm system SPASM domain peptide maturase [Bacteroidales bacterium]
MKIDTDKHIIMFENCQLTRGVNRTVISDFQRHQIDFLDNKIFEIINNQSRDFSIKQILNNYNKQDQDIILEYFEFLLDKEYAFLCDKSEIDFFPKLNLEWDYPASITNCIIDLNKNPDFSVYNQLIKDLDYLNCEDIQIRDYYGVLIDLLCDFLNKFNGTTLIRIELILKKTEHLNIYKKIVKSYPRINSLILHSSSINKNYKISMHQTMACRKINVTDENCCGIVSANYFNLRLEHFLESQYFNTCLNRKVSIDKKGQIKNCPAMKNSFGHISNTSVIDVIKLEEFQAVWKIKKDSIKICKDCEFRYICTDCRAFLESDISTSKPHKCKYNPYE